jgi:hypothetical protein
MSILLTTLGIILGTILFIFLMYCAIGISTLGYKRFIEVTKDEFPFTICCKHSWKYKDYYKVCTKCSKKVFQ